MSVAAFEGKAPRVHPTAFIHQSALVLGDVELGADASVWPLVVARGDVNAIVIGARSNIQDSTILHVTHDGPYAPGGHRLTVGEGVTVGHRVILHGCSIGDYCLIGMGSIVMDGAVLEPRVMLGAGSTVPGGKHLEGGHLWVGSPARKVRRLTRDEEAMLEYSAAHYVRLATRHAACAES